MAEAVVSVALQTLSDLVIEEARFLSGVTDQVEEISRELKRMKLFLKDADSRTHDDESVRNWLREIRFLAYKVEDIVETYAVEVGSRRRRGFEKIFKRFACIVCEAKSLHNIGSEIAKAKRDLSNITSSLQRYDIKAIGAGANSSVVNENQWWGRQTYAHQFEEHFVGMEKDMKKLVSLVLDDGVEERHHVISIWGMGGLGKTTLARKIYNHRDVQRCFGLFAWACITQHGQIREILQDILIQLAPEMKTEAKGMADRDLVRQLHQVQNGRKCLIFLDDIWKADDWKNLVAAFPIAEGGSKILLTTRDRKIAEIGFPYAPKFLTENESWELFQRIAFSRDNVEDFKIERELEDVGKEMVRKCRGLPLAVSVLGGILKDKSSLTEWQRVNKHVSTYLSKVEDGHRDGGVVARVLSLSYNELPYYLRPCFLYLASYKEDEMIEVEQLCQLWMAEGMILSQHRRREETLIEVAERYLDELACRSMVQVRVQEFPMARKYDKCSLHDMMRDLCMEKAREEEFIQVVDHQSDRQSLLEPSHPTNFSCRLVFHMDDIDNVGQRAAKTSSAQQNHQQLRSLSYVSKLKEKAITWPQGIVDLEHTKPLRALQFEGFDFQNKKLPVELRKMIHLRYLKVINCRLHELPSSISELPFLHTLHIRVENDIKVPNVLCKMKQLRHLYIYGLFGHHTENGKLRLHGLHELETLDGLQSTTDEVSDLTDLLNLRVLVATISDKNSLHIIIDHISKNELKLKETDLRIHEFDLVGSEEGSVLLRKVVMCDNLHHLALEVEMSKFPKYEPQMLRNLVYLRLDKNKIEDDPMKELEMLPELQTLVLETDAYIGKDMTCHAWGFQKLRGLRLFGLSNLECWRVDEGAMPRMSSLGIYGCEKLEMIPDGLKFVRSLENLIIHGMPGKFCDRIQDKGIDYYKIEHVPSITVGFVFDSLLKRQSGDGGSAIPPSFKRETLTWPLCSRKSFEIS